MLHLLKRHPIPIAAHFEHVLVLTYAFPCDLLVPLLPPGLELDTFGDHAFLAVATVQTRDLRPAFLPKAFGRGFFLTGYRLFTRLKLANGQVLRGLRILRSDTDSAFMVSWGNRLTRCGYRIAEVQCRKENGLLHMDVKTPTGEADLELTANISNIPGPLPQGSPFPNVETARRFAGPLPHTFDYEPESHSMIVVRGRRSQSRSRFGEAPFSSRHHSAKVTLCWRMHFIWRMSLTVGSADGENNSQERSGGARPGSASHMAESVIGVDR